MKLRQKSRQGRPQAHRLSIYRPVVEELEDRNLLNAGTLSVASQIVHSVENYQDLVSQDYQTLLHRPADAGAAGWVQALENGATAEQVQAGIAASPEYLALHGNTNSGLVNGLYQDFLNRTPSTAETNAWVQALNSGVTPFNVALAFATSPERDSLVVTADYQHILNRPPDPGAAYWVTQLENGLGQLNLEADLVGSDEFYQLSGGTDAGFISDAYQVVLGRPASDTEISNWQTVLDQAQGTHLLTLHLKPLDINLLGVEVQTNDITVYVSALPGQGELLGNLLTDASNLLNFQGVNNALNNVLGSVVDLLNGASLNVSGVTTNSGPLSSAPAATVPVLDAFVAPVHLNLLGALVDTSPIHLTITAHSGPGLILGNVVADLANLFNPPLPSSLNLDTINQALGNLLGELQSQLPANLLSQPASTPTTPAGQEQILSLTVPPINLNLLGLVLKTSTIQVNANAQTGNGDLLGNVLTTLLNTLGATPQNLSTLNANLNALLSDVVGVLNASSLLLSGNALTSLSQVLQQLASGPLVNPPANNVSTPILNLTIASTNGTTPPVDVNLLGLIVTTSNIQVQLLAQTGSSQILGNLLYNVANLLNPGGSLDLLSILNVLGL